MSAEKGTNVLIGGKVYTLSGKDSDEYIQRVALYINNKIDELTITDNSKKLSTNLRAVLLQLNIADDYFKEKERNNELIKIIELKDAEIDAMNNALLQADIKSDEVRNEEERERERLKDIIVDLEKQIEIYKAEIDEYIELFDKNE